MLPAAHRMRRRSDFEVAVRRGRRAGRRTLVVHAALTGAAGEPPRVGFVVSRGVGGSVVRNQVKRRLRAVLSARVGDFPAGALVVVRANPAASQASSVLLAADVDAALPRVLTGASSRAAVVPGSGGTGGDGAGTGAVRSRRP